MRHFDSRKICFLLFIIIILTIIVILVLRWFSSPSKGTFKITSKKSEAELSLVIAKTFDRKYYVLKDIPDFELKLSTESASGTPDKIVLLGNDINSKKLVISTESATDGDITSVSGVTMRKQNPKLYTENIINLDGRQGIVFERSDNTFEKTAFFLHNGFSTTISYTSPMLNVDVNESYSRILSNFYWK